MKLSILLVSILLGVALAAPSGDLVTNLPGLNFATNYSQYSGYLDATANRHLHYWLFESQNDPVNDPLILWMNGGPGCSSLLGLFTELGPFYVDQGGSGELHPNPYAWNTFANLLFLEAPACVGFSYSDGNCASSDDSTASENYAALQDFFSKFPEYQTSEFYITGESYCGIYIPTLTELIVDGAATSPVPFNFQGFAIGNGCMDMTGQTTGLMFYGYYHSLVGDDLWAGMTSDCCGGVASRSTCDFNSNYRDCQTYVNLAFERFYVTGLDPYNIYSQCSTSATSSRMNVELRHLNKRFKISPEPFDTIDPDTYDPSCSNNDPEINYLNSADVKTALHISNSAPAWSPCAGIAYNTQYDSVIDKMAYVASQTRGLIFSGDADMVCNFLPNLWDIEDLGLDVVDDRRKWMGVDGQIAGYVKRFTNLDFLTVKGSGHMVPGYEPADALKMIKAFILQTDY